jgi:ubiquinone/menaquinone biosynthesis C-methylase UbiE
MVTAAGAADRLVWAVEQLDVQPDDRLLEVGCGHGVAVTLVCDRLEDGNVLAIDRSRKMIDLAARRNATHIETGRASFLVASLAEADLGDLTFDKVLAVHVGVFLRGDPSRELEMIRRHLAPGGALWLSYQPLDADQTEPTIARLTGALAANAFAVTGYVVADLASGRTLCVVAAPS